MTSTSTHSETESTKSPIISPARNPANQSFTLTPSRSFVSTPCRTPGTGRRHRKSIILSVPRTPKDVRQLNRDEMIEILRKFDQDIPDNIDQEMRSTLQKRVIHCMNQKNGNPSSTHVDSPFPWPQSAHQNTRVSRKRRAECPLTGALNKRMKMSTHEPLPIKTLDEDISHHEQKEQKEQEMDFSSLRRLSISPHPHSNESWTQRLLQRVKKGVPARYDILSLTHSILNLEENTSYLRSSKMQKMYEVCHTDDDMSCDIRTLDDVYQLNEDEIEQIELSVNSWILKYGPYSSNIHPSIRETEENTLCATDPVFRYEVLGRFIGDEMVENEFQEIYAGTFDEYRRSLHSWVFEVNIPVVDSTGDYSMRNVKYEQYDMLVDCLGKTQKEPSKLLLIEDCREDLSNELTTKEDLKKENVLFITIEINGWPGKFAIAKRTIQKDEILYGHFGDGYGSLNQNVKRQQQSVDFFVSSIERLLEQQNEDSLDVRQ